MTQRKNSRSSVISMEDENIDLLDFDADKDDDSADYIETDLGTDNIEDIIQDETLIIVKNTIDKLACTVNNVSELTKKLYTEFIEDNNLTQILTDLVEMSEAFNGLDSDELERAIRENIHRLKRCYQERESEKLRRQYREVNDDDFEALKLQMQLRDKIKLRTGDK